MMNIHRITNLPAIRVYEHNTMDTSSDHHSSLLSHRTLPRDIPIPKHGSPTSSRGGSMHGSLASQGVPPILSLDPPTLPQPPHHPYHYDEPTQEEWMTDGGNGVTRPRRPMVITRSGGREGSESYHPSPRGWAQASSARQRGDPQHEPPGVNDGISIKQEKSLEKSLQDVLFRKMEGGRKLSRHIVKELQDDASLRKVVQESVKAYDTSVLRKLNSGRSDPSPLSRHRHTPPRDFRPFTSGSDDSARSPSSANWGQPKDRTRNLPTSNPIPIPGPGTLENPFERWAHSASGDGVIARMSQLPELNPPVFPPSMMDYRNSVDNASVSSYLTDNDAPSNGDSHMRRSISASILGPGYDDSGVPNSMPANSYDLYGEESDVQMDDTPASHVSQMRRLTLHEDRTPPKSNSYPLQSQQRAGSKRRASSPPNEDRAVGTSEPTRKGLLLENVGSDIYNHSRRTPPIHHGLRTSPSGPSKYHTSSGIHYSPVPRSASGSFTSASASSGTTMWSSSIGPFSAASSITTADRGSPATSFSFPSDMEIICDSPFRQVSTTSSNRPNNRQRILSETTVATSPRERDGGTVKHHSAPKMGLFICECCPKKPKKFENYKDLRLHEMEKQYSCQYCNNRFKNKNEAERHQNSLHLRKHSWSCAALSSCEAAFHQSPQRPNSADICGYCGKEFQNPPQWNTRTEHLMTEHKFGECNQSKKFYRADHFRQHLKHSHSGTSGKWTNLLENACMRDEIPPTSALSLGTAVAVISEEASD